MRECIKNKQKILLNTINLRAVCAECGSAVLDEHTRATFSDTWPNGRRHLGQRMLSDYGCPPGGLRQYALQLQARNLHRVNYAQSNCRLKNRELRSKTGNRPILSEWTNLADCLILPNHCESLSAIPPTRSRPPSGPNLNVQFLNQPISTEFRSCSIAVALLKSDFGSNDFGDVQFASFRLESSKNFRSPKR